MKYLTIAVLVLSTSMASAVTREDVARECGKYFANKTKFNNCQMELHNGNR